MDNRTRRALTGALFVALTFVSACERSAVPVTSAEPPADKAAVRILVVRLGGGTEDFELLSSGRVLHKTDWDSRELRIPPENVARLERDLLACGICTLEPADPLPTGPSRRRIDVEVLTQPKACSANLPWEKWGEDKAARVCLVAIEGALQPLRDQCGECTVPHM